MGTTALLQAAESYRAQSVEMQAAAENLLSDVAKPTLSQKEEISVIVGLLAARMYGSLAVLSTALAAASGPASEIESRRSEFSAWTNKVRQASAKGAATGDYSEYDKLMETGWNPNTPASTETPANG